MGMYSWGRVRRKRDVMRFAQCRSLKKSGNSAAAGCIRLQNVNSSSAKHSLKVSGVVAVFTCGNFHTGRRSIAQQSQPCKIVGGNGLLEPTYIQIREFFRLRQSLFSAVSSIRIDKKFGRGTNRIARRA